MCTPSYVYLRTSPIFQFCLVAVSLVGLHETEELLTLRWLLFRFIRDVALVPADKDGALQLRFRSDQDPGDTCKLFFHFHAFRRLLHGKCSMPHMFHM